MKTVSTLQHQYSHRYHVWNDASASWNPNSFSTLQDAIDYAEQWPHPTHAKRIYHMQQHIATVLPLEIVNRHVAKRINLSDNTGTIIASIRIAA